MLNKWVFWDKNEILALFEEYKVKNQKHIYSLNTRVKKLIESWIKIHTEELKELDNQLRSETRTIKDKS